MILVKGMMMFIILRISYTNCIENIIGLRVTAEI